MASREQVEAWAHLSEAKVIAYLVLREEAMRRYSMTLTENHFVDVFHRELFSELTRAWKSNPESFCPASVVVKKLGSRYPTVKSEFAKLVDQNEIGRSSKASWRYHEDMLHRALIARGVEWVGEQLLKAGDSESDPLELYQKTIREFEERKSKFEFQDSSFQTAMKNYLETLQSGNMGFLTTGMAWIDELELLHRGGNCVLAAKPGTGKTAFAIQTTLSAARRGLKSCFVSLEMPIDQIMERFAISGSQTRKNNLPSSVDKVAQLTTELDGKIFPIAASGKTTVEQIDARVTNLISEGHDIDIVVVDHIGIVSPGKRTENRVNDVTHVSNALRSFAIERNVALVTLCQMPRSSGDAPPGLSHLKDSSAIEEDSTAVVFLHQPDKSVDELDFLCRKNRHGRTGEFSGIVFDKALQKFMLAPNEFDDWNDR